MRQPVTTTEVRVVRDYYASHGPAFCAALLGCDVRRVYRIASRRLKVRTKAPRGRSFAKGHDPRRGEGKRFGRAA
jgi:hypothetical protein